MTRRPRSLKEAREIVREERVKVTSSISAIAGSRWLLAILATFVIAFGAHLAYAPTRLPPVGGVSVTALGLSLGLAGNVRTQTLPAFSADDMAKVLAKVK